MAGPTATRHGMPNQTAADAPAPGRRTQPHRADAVSVRTPRAAEEAREKTRVQECTERWSAEPPPQSRPCRATVAPQPPPPHIRGASGANKQRLPPLPSAGVAGGARLAPVRRARSEFQWPVGRRLATDEATEQSRPKPLAAPEGWSMLQKHRHSSTELKESKLQLDQPSWHRLRQPR